MANCEAWETHLKGRPNDANAKWRRNDLIRHIRCRLGIKYAVEQARCAFLRKRGIGVEPQEEAKVDTSPEKIGKMCYAPFFGTMDYVGGRKSAEELWQAMGECVQYVARVIADREGQSRPPAAVRMMIPDCDVRSPELIG
ncbi:hypothetical protein [Komagataeibacter phage phiKX2]|nr:hypothetical protein [Komagataeibacter phage phiKX2]